MKPIKSVIHMDIAAMTPRKRALLAFLCGCGSVFALAPFTIWPLWLIGFAVLASIQYCAATAKQSFWTGWCYGFGYFTCGLYWISFALGVEIEKWWWLMPFAAIGLPLLLSVFYGIAAFITHKLTRHKSPARFALLLAISFAFIEYLRGFIFTGFPWNLPAYIWINSPAGQSLAIWGAYGLTALTFLWGSALFVAGKTQKHLLGYAALFLFAISYGYGAMRINAAPESDSDAMNIVDQKRPIVALIQPNIPQKDKWRKEKRWENFLDTVKLSATAGQEQQPDLIIWPETALTFPARDIKQLSTYFSPFLQDGQKLITGVLDFPDATDETPEAFYNSLVVVDDQGHITQQYNKHHLVPFGEYVPFRNLLSIGPIANALSNTGDFTRGDGVSVIETPLKSGGSFRFLPLICYEIIFPEKTFHDDQRPDAIINITNDAWYGNTSGPHQHLAITRARAIESGIPVLRIASTGISAIIDGHGRVTSDIPLSTTGIVESIMPPPQPVTLYGKYRNALFYILMLLSISIYVFTIQRNTKD